VGVGLLVLMILLELCTSYRSSCYHYLPHLKFKKNTEWRHSGTGLHRSTRKNGC